MHVGKCPAITLPLKLTLVQANKVTMCAGALWDVESRGCSRHQILKHWMMIWYDMIWYDMIWYDMIWYDMIWYDVSTWTSPNVGRLGFSVIRLLSGWLSVGILYNACDYVSFWEGNCVGKRLGDPWIFRFSEMRNLDQHLSYIHGSCFLSNIQSILVVVSQRMLREHHGILGGTLYKTKPQVTTWIQYPRKV